ncbi:Glycosyl hydrolase catalytic core domain-containing protein 4 [Elsinoe fawcettii]|nr:Glycosyl hydrolase catalytic core domain-containing protein 4 [Elsinoe fawcettii]
MLATAALSLLALAPAAFAAKTSAKRGIVYVTPEVVTDNNFWTDKSNDLTWYYNYATAPTGAFAGSNMQFIPMQWGMPAQNPDVDRSFYNSVKQLQKTQNVTWVLGFNEPDGCDNGGSCVDAKQAAIAWVKQFEPMRKDLGVKLGGPGCTGAASGWTWLQAFHTACAELKNNNTGCEMDFLPIHWYGNFDGLASHLGRVNSTYSNVSEIWVTEFAYANEDLQTTQQFYNLSIDYFDRLDIIGKYSYFGPFRSDVSNVGPNVPFLTGDGKLTDIGSWYLGGDATGNLPTTTRSTATSGNLTSTRAGTYSGKPYSSGSRRSVSPGWFVGGLTALTVWALF